MREVFYVMPCPGSFTPINLEGDDFVRLPDGVHAATGIGTVFIAMTLTGRAFYAIEGCLVIVDLDEVLD